MDTLRADHLGCYGYRRGTTPNIDRFAAKGVVFENAFSPSAWTLPAHTTMLSGLTPRHHGTGVAGRAIPGEVPLLAELLKQRGYTTTAVVNGVFLQSKFGFSRGFDEFVYVPKREWRRHQQTVLETVRQVDRSPFFIFLHFMYVHNPYNPPPQFNRFVRPYDGPLEMGKGSLRHLKEALSKGETSLDEAGISYLVDLYDGGILWLDSVLGEVFDALEARSLGNTFILITSDHGEEFMEHGSLLHNGSLHEELIAVPLILRGPSIPAGARVTSMVGLVDVTPTILDLAGVVTPPSLDGRSLVGSWHEEHSRDRVLELLTSFPQGEQMKAGLRTPSSKLIVDLETGERQFYNLEMDPKELRNLYPDPGALVLERMLQLTSGGPAGEPVRLDDKDLTTLRSLGYVQ